MRLLDLLFPERRNSAVIAKDRLKIVLAHERASSNAPRASMRSPLASVTRRAAPGLACSSFRARSATQL